MEQTCQSTVEDLDVLIDLLKTYENRLLDAFAFRDIWGHALIAMGAEPESVQVEDAPKSRSFRVSVPPAFRFVKTGEFIIKEIQEINDSWDAGLEDEICFVDEVPLGVASRVLEKWFLSLDDNTRSALGWPSPLFKHIRGKDAPCDAPDADDLFFSAVPTYTERKALLSAWMLERFDDIARVRLECDVSQRAEAGFTVDAGGVLFCGSPLQLKPQAAAVLRHVIKSDRFDEPVDAATLAREVGSQSDPERFARNMTDQVRKELRRSADVDPAVARDLIRAETSGKYPMIRVLRRHPVKS